MSLTADMTLSEVLRRHRGASRVFDDIGIDYACGGSTTLRAAAASAGVTPNELLALLSVAPAISTNDWNAAPLGDLTRHLAHDHFRLIGGLFGQVRSAIDVAIENYGHLPLLNRLHEIAESLGETIAQHAAAEERDLFPMVERLEAAATTAGVEAPQARISARVLREHLEHEHVRDRVHALRDLAAELHTDYDVSLVVAHLRAFHRHLNEHMHLENNVLYPRAIAIENALRHARPLAVY